MSNIVACFDGAVAEVEKHGIPAYMRYAKNENRWKRGTEDYYAYEEPEKLAASDCVIKIVKIDGKIQWDFLDGKTDYQTFFNEVHNLPIDDRKRILSMCVSQVPMISLEQIPENELWWQKERREKKAAMDKMVAMRNSVRQIHGL